MITRQATPEDLPEIIALLKESLGEALTPKTEAYFRWKHEANPFGRSKILLSEADGRIVGLRAFMRWRWISDTDSISAVRAVDTATHPEYQGKGIFKTLTLQVVDDCTQEKVGLVFNSPNAVSIQGYLKMGWMIAGRLPLYLGFGSPVPRLLSESFASKVYAKYSVQAQLQKLPANWEMKQRSKKLITHLNLPFLSWRYRDCPVATYGAVIENGSFGFIFRIKKLSRFFELRICEAWTENDSAHRSARDAFRRLVFGLRPAIISCATSPLYCSGKKKITLLSGPFRRGPVITIRPLFQKGLQQFKEFGNWAPSLGSMELF